MTVKSFRYYFLLIISFFFAQSSFAQGVLTPTKCTFSTKKISDCEVEILMKVTIDPKWHINSLNAGEGPFSTLVVIEKNPGYKAIGKPLEPKPIEKYDSIFESKVRYFEHEVTFRQKVKILKDGKHKVKGSIEFTACTEEGMCLPPDVNEFELEIQGKSCAASAVDTAAVLPPDGVLTDTPAVKHANPDAAVVKSTSKAPVDTKKAAQLSKWSIFLQGFFGGLLALFTPCVFPMLPLTVSFFTKQSKSRKKGIANAFLYSFSIILIYVTLGLLITIPLGPDALNDLASNGIMNMAFFILFVIFAISFLGAFEITLPASWINKADSASDKGGFVGIFFMAFTLSLVSFSCTGPIIGTLLVQAAVGGEVINPALGMVGFSSALAVPFGLFAAFPGWLNSLPKSGAWLNSVKVVLGLLELALALKFLSNVDLAYHWGILTREIFLSIWIIIFIMLGFYLLGKIKFSHDSDTSYVSIPRFMFALFSFAFVIYLVPGLFGAPLKLISGFPPPTHYTEGWTLGGISSGSGNTDTARIEGVDPAKCPHQLNCFKDYELALAYAKKVRKPLMVDFTGHTCVNCRKMEEKVWSDPKVLQQIRNEYVLVSLYVDDKIDLPQDKQYLSSTTGKKVKTYGNKWSDFQTSRFGTNTQPYYVLLDHNEELLNDPEGYDPDIANYLKFLEAGKEEFMKRTADTLH